MKRFPSSRRFRGWYRYWRRVLGLVDHPHVAAPELLDEAVSPHVKHEILKIKLAIHL